jgi:hypothetical protein
MPVEGLPPNDDPTLEYWGTVLGWSEKLGVPEPALRQRLESAEGETRLDGEGRRRIFYAETYVREKLQEVLQMPKVKKGGDFEWKGETYGHKAYWTRRLGTNMSIEEGAISILLNQHGVGITAMTHGGTVRQESFFPESQVMELVNALPQADNEKYIIQGEQSYWTIKLNPFEEYRKQFEFKYEEIVIAKAPSGKIRRYYLQEAVKRILGYDPLETEERRLDYKEEAVRKAKEKKARMYDPSPKVTEQRDVIRILFEAAKFHEEANAKYEQNGKMPDPYMFNIRRPKVPSKLRKPEEQQPLIDAIKREYPTASDWIHLKYRRLSELGQKVWSPVATILGFIGDPGKNVDVRVMIARRVYGEQDEVVAQYLGEMTELAKDYKEPLGEVALQWIEIIRATFADAQEWLKVRVPSAPYEKEKESMRAVRLLGRRFGYSSYQMGLPHIRVRVGFSIYGADNSVLLAAQQKIEADTEAKLQEVPPVAGNTAAEGEDTADRWDKGEL